MILGLTGGIASGKSTVSSLFKHYGFPVIDADVGAREVVEKGSPGLRRIQEYFGDKVIQTDGALDRGRLGQEVFSDEVKREALNQILAEDIQDWISRQLETAKAAGAPLIVMDIPLLFEAGYDRITDKTMVVTVSKNVQLERLVARNGLTREEAWSRIQAQMPLDEKAKKADFLIDNNGSLEETEEQVKQWLIEQGFIQQT